VLDDLVVGACGTTAFDEDFAWSKSGDGVYDMLVVMVSF
jgi:hypothetical protein